jgi:hypothetical protein
MLKHYEALSAAMKGKKKVSVRRSIVGVTVRHYETDIFSVKLYSVVLSSGGLFSVTTKRHINNCFAALGLHSQVYQRNGTWYVSDEAGEEHTYFDGISILL